MFAGSSSDYFLNQISTCYEVTSAFKVKLKKKNKY